MKDETLKRERNGYTYYERNQLLHREDGPAVRLRWGSRYHLQWALSGVRLTTLYRDII